ncbi:MAG: hypothetical protein ACOCNB_10550 [Acetivibrio ethanolgignens]
MAIKYRCFRCMKVLRADGTCQNPKCIRYVPEEETEEKADTAKPESESES